MNPVQLTIEKFEYILKELLDTGVINKSLREQCALCREARAMAILNGDGNIPCPYCRIPVWFGVRCAKQREWLELTALSYAGGRALPKQERGCAIDLLYFYIGNLKSHAEEERDDLPPDIEERMKNAYGANNDPT